MRVRCVYINKVFLLVVFLLFNYLQVTLWPCCLHEIPFILNRFTCTCTAPQMFVGLFIISSAMMDQALFLMDHHVYLCSVSCILIPLWLCQQYVYKNWSNNKTFSMECQHNINGISTQQYPDMTQHQYNIQSCYTTYRVQLCVSWTQTFIPLDALSYYIACLSVVMG